MGKALYVVAPRVLDALDAIGVSLGGLLSSQYGTGRLPPLLFYGAAVLFLGTSVFMAWRDEYVVKLKLETVLNDRETRRKGRERLGVELESLSECERSAYEGHDADQYHAVRRKLKDIEENIGAISEDCFDASLASRYKAVNVQDTLLDEATRMHFFSRGQGDFWTVYGKIKGQRNELLKILEELGND